MARHLLVMALACLLVPSITVAQVTEVWASRYGSPGTWNDSPSDIAVDALGNVYVAGSVEANYRQWDGVWDYLTVKYDAAGHELWAVRYNGTGNYADAAQAIAVDAAGNVYVTGRSWGSGHNFDYVTIKYDAGGNELWVARFNAEGGDDAAVDMAIDHSGRIYVTGYVTGTTPGAHFWDYATVAYDADGHELWVARYDGPANSDDVARAIAIDGAGHVHVTGYSWGGVGTGYDYATVQYDSDGNQLWVARYSDPGSGSWDFADAIAVDASGGVYVTGAVGTEGATAYGTVKYDAAGQQLWVARFATNPFISAQLAVDGDGNAYVSGVSSEPGTASDFATIKYDTHGNERWTAPYNGPANRDDIPGDIVLDAAGGVYVTGRSDGADDRSDFTTIKYDPDGNERWIISYNGPANSFDDAIGIAIDTAGNVYVSGASDDPATARDWVTVKYAPPDPVEQFTLSVTRAGSGSGTVTSDPWGIDCGADCEQMHRSGTSVTLTATAALGSVFTRWHGCDATAGKACTVNVNADRSVRARFRGAPRLPIPVPSSNDSTNRYGLLMRMRSNRM